MGENLSLTKLKSYLTDPLRRNAVFIMLTNAVAAIFGFFFWLVAARFYSTEEVGLATALISATALLGTIAKVGFDFGLVRFLPQSKDRSAIINTCYTIAGILSLVTAVVFLLGLGFWSPKLLFIRSSWIYIVAFIAFTCLSTINQLQGQVFIAFRATHYFLSQNLIGGLRLLIIVFLTFSGAFGIFSSMGLASILSILVGLIFIFKSLPGYRPVPSISNTVVRDMTRFSLTNYVASIFGSLPVYLLPLIIIGVLTPEAGAYFNVSWSIAGILSMATAGTTSSLLTEGSYDQSNLAKQVVKTLKFNLFFILPGIVVLLILGKLILSLYGADYASNSLWLLWLFAIMYIPQSVIMLFLTVARIQMKVKAIILTDATLAILTVGFSYMLMKFIGLIGVGIVFISVQSVTAVITGLIMLKMVGISPRTLPGLIIRRSS
jgi:O-antigen/teichoic acid export membrane protein